MKISDLMGELAAQITQEQTTMDGSQAVVDNTLQQAALANTAPGTSTVVTPTTVVSTTTAPTISNGTHAMVGLGSYAGAAQIGQLIFGVFTDFGVTVGTNTQVAVIVVIGLLIHLLVIKKILPSSIEGD